MSSILELARYSLLTSNAFGVFCATDNNQNEIADVHLAVLRMTACEVIYCCFSSCS